MEGPQSFPGEAVAGAVSGYRGGAGSGEIKESMMDCLWGVRERERSRMTVGSGLRTWARDGPN